MIEAVVFDVGETLVDETREYGTWADWLGVPRHTFASVFGAVIAAGKDYRETFEVFRPGFDLTREREARVVRGGRFVRGRSSCSVGVARDECMGRDCRQSDRSRRRTLTGSQVANGLCCDIG